MLWTYAKIKTVRNPLIKNIVLESAPKTLAGFSGRASFFVMENGRLDRAPAGVYRSLSRGDRAGVNCESFDERAMTYISGIPVHPVIGTFSDVCRVAPQSATNLFAGENIPPNECESLSVKLMRLEMVSHGARSVNQSRKATVKSCADADGQQVQTGSLSTVIRLS